MIHFVDHEVIRAYAGRDTLGGPHGIIYSLVDPERRVRRRIGVPYSSVKAIFKVKRWDSRGSKPSQTFTRVAKILADREGEARASGTDASAIPRRRPILDRARKK